MKGSLTSQSYIFCNNNDHLYTGSGVRSPCITLSVMSKYARISDSLSI